jgi:hypothetical protein
MKEILTTDGICTGRNGTVDIRSITVYMVGGAFDSGLIRIDAISRSRGIMLNAGLSFDMDCAKALRDELTRILKETRDE